jgi:hypothetical protein
MYEFGYGFVERFGESAEVSDIYLISNEIAIAKAII